ncbi:putative Mg2+ transporter-C (MgtC) family protein [Paenibacillus anaericanus]|uniref:MgtC/SapB family protein n=1 Tax=Paenibacillus anaericanus TaxID=170367 RepID=UPI00277F4EF3|nr:MgtC/SapB family protein [Paenibacillus anaericanus]MDQ0088503.1 putative Mg2+ transporter-C (MgtC) family protein [Paenibacillus anaericanus]
MEFELLLRVLLAGVCGVVIGYERKNRRKEAGIRTHFVVAVGAALMIIISKYGFQDQIGWENLSLDPSRMAAGVVSGVGFLGAGMIFIQKQSVIGLTTAAGIWATAGLGMSIGAGMYLIGIGVTLILVLGQIILHSHFIWTKSPKTERLLLVLANEEGAIDKVMERLKDGRIEVSSFTSESHELEISLELTVTFQGAATVMDLVTLIQDEPFVKKVAVE